MGKNKNWFIESTVEAGEVVINDGGSSVDFRIEGDSDANLFVTDGSADKVGIGTSAPSTKLEVTSDTIGELMTISNHNVSASMPAELMFKKSRGSKSSPSTVAASDELGQISWTGYDGSNYDELAYIKVESSNVDSETAKMTLHADTFVIDTGTIQFGTSGDFSGTAKGIHKSTTTLDSSASDDYLVTAKTLYSNLDVSALSGVTWSVSTSGINSLPRLNSADPDVLGTSNVYSSGSSGSVSIGADTTSADAGNSIKFSVTGTSSMVGAFNVGVSGTGHDVTFFGDDANRNFFWDQSAMSLALGSNDLGVDFTVFGATANYKLFWDESADKLFIYGHAQLGYAAGNSLEVVGTLKPASDSSAVMIKPYSSSQSADLFQVFNEDSTKSFWIEDTGETVVNNALKIDSDGYIQIGDDLKFEHSGHGSIINFDKGESGSKTFSLKHGATERFKITSGGNITIQGVVDTIISTTSATLKSPYVAINSLSGSTTAGELRVAKVTTASGNLTLDSSGGTVSVVDNLAVTGDLTVSGSTDFSGTTSSSFHIASGGNNLGWKAINMADANTSPLGNVAKWIHPVDSTGNVDTAGIATRYIASDSKMYITTKDTADDIIINPGNNHSSGSVLIGSGASKAASLIVYGNGTIHGNLTVSGTLTGSLGASGTSEPSFQIDDDTTGPKLTDVTTDSNALGIYTSADVATHIQALGMKTTANYGANDVMAFSAHNNKITMTPHSQTANDVLGMVDITGVVQTSGNTSLSNKLLGSTIMGDSAHSSHIDADAAQATTMDTMILANTGYIGVDANINAFDIVGMDVYFGRNGATGNEGFGKSITIYGSSASNKMVWLGASNKLTITGTNTNTALSVAQGNTVIGKSSISCDFSLVGTSKTILFSDGSEDTLSIGGYTKFTEGQAQTVKTFSSDANGDLEITESGEYVLISNAMAGNRVITLPSAATAVGVHYKFRLTVDLSGTLNIVSNATGELFIGGVTHVDTDSDEATTVMDTQVLVAAADEGIQLKADTKAGSWLEVVCDGSEWYINGTIHAHTAPTYVDV